MLVVRQPGLQCAFVPATHRSNLYGLGQIRCSTEHRILLPLGDTLFFHTFAFVGESQSLVRVNEIRIHVEHNAILCNRLVVLPRNQEVIPKVQDKNQVERVEFSSNLVLSNGFFKAAHGIEVPGVDSVAEGVARIELNRALKLAFRSGPVPVISPSHPAERAMGNCDVIRSR